MMDVVRAFQSSIVVKGGDSKTKVTAMDDFRVGAMATALY
jgi:hypothetical protein